MTVLFDTYPARPAVIDAAADAVEAKAQKVYESAIEADKQARKASMLASGMVVDLVVNNGAYLPDRGSHLRELGDYAAGVVRAWSLAVALHDAGVAALNEEYTAAAADGFGVEEPPFGEHTDAAVYEKYAAARSAAGAAKLAELKRRYAELGADLDDVARELARLLDTGPSDDTWRHLADYTEVPPDYLPPPPETAPEKGDPAWLQALTLLAGDPRSCIGPDASVAACTFEAVTLLPTTKVLKFRRLATWKRNGPRRTPVWQRPARRRRVDARLPGLPTNAPKVLGRGSTGRTTPKDFTEQLAMTEVRSAPDGQVLSAVRLDDYRWNHKDGWVKVQQIFGDVLIHYNRNERTGQVDDFKFVDRKAR